MTRAREFRAQEIQRKHAKPPTGPRRRKRDDLDTVDTSRPTVSVSDRMPRGLTKGLQNWKAKAGQRSGAALEENNGKPSRKSTRGSTNGQRQGATKQITQVVAAHSPRERNVRGNIQGKTVRGGSHTKKR